MLITILEAYAVRAENQNSSPFSRIDTNDSKEDLKPAIDSISDITYHLDEYTFNVEFTLYFHGTDKIDIELEEEFDTCLLCSNYRGPGKVHVKTGRRCSVT